MPVLPAPRRAAGLAGAWQRKARSTDEHTWRESNGVAIYPAAPCRIASIAPSTLCVLDAATTTVSG